MKNIRDLLQHAYYQQTQQLSRREAGTRKRYECGDLKFTDIGDTVLTLDLLATK